MTCIDEGMKPDAIQCIIITYITEWGSRHFGRGNHPAGRPG